MDQTSNEFGACPDVQRGVNELRAMRPGELDDVVERLAMTSAVDIRHRLRDRLTTAEPDAVIYVVVAERDGEITGAGKITSEPVFPGTVSVAVATSPHDDDLANQLMDWVDARLAKVQGMKSATMALRDDFNDTRRLAERYGFTLRNHDLGLRLALDGPARALAARAHVAADQANVRVRVADLDTEESTIMAAVARGQIGLLVPFGEEQTIDSAATRALIPEKAVVLLAENGTGTTTVCGVTVVAPHTGSDEWQVEFTGVDPNFRSRGVATALKTASHLEAFKAGAHAVTTLNEETNQAIISLNRKLGMTPTVGYWGLVRPLTRALGNAPS